MYLFYWSQVTDSMPHSQTRYMKTMVEQAHCLFQLQDEYMAALGGK